MLEINVSSSSGNQEICVVMQDSVLVPRVPYVVPVFMVEQWHVCS